MIIRINLKEQERDDTWETIRVTMGHPQGAIDFIFELPPDVLYWFAERDGRYLHRFLDSAEDEIKDVIENMQEEPYYSPID